MTKLTNIYETGGWPKGRNDCLKEEAIATKCSDHCTISLIKNTAKIVARIL
jgi:hypothetical protein